MLYTEMIVGDNTYKLRLGAMQMIALEDRMGKNPMTALTSGELPTLKDMMDIFHASLQEYQHKIKFEDACHIFDEFCAEDGNDQTKFFWFLMKVLQNNGYVSKDVDFDKIAKSSEEEVKKQLEEVDPKN